jgi:hypothetical protein
MADGGAPENDHQQMASEGGKNSIEKKRKSPPRDDNYKMADGSAPENDLQQMTSEGGKNSTEKKRKQEPAQRRQLQDGGRVLLRTTSNRWPRKAAMQGQTTTNSG